MAPKKLHFAVTAALMNAITVGIASTYSSTATESMKSSQLDPNITEISWIGSILPLGAIVGGIVAGYMSDKIGRKGVMIYLSLPLLLGWLLIAYATSLSFVYAGRFFTGLCCGLICVVTPMYIVEISTPKQRGNLGCGFQLFICLGIIIVSTLGRYLPWNWLAIPAAVFAVLTPFCMLCVPESPKWLFMRGKQAEAVQAVRFLYGDETEITTDLISDNEDKQPANVINVHKILHPTVYKPALLSVALMFFQQFSGSNAILYYTVSIFKEAKSSIDPSIGNIVVAICMWFATLVSCFLMDVLGRKKSLFISGLGTCLTLNILSTYIFISSNNPSLKDTYGWVPLISLLLYIAAFSVGLGPIPWLMMSEMSPSHARGLICGIGTALSWIFVFVITKSFSDIESVIHNYGAFWVYSVFSLLCCFFTMFFLPETKGRSLEEIETYFLGGELLREVSNEEYNNENAD